MTIEPMYADSGIYRSIVPDAPYSIRNASGYYYTGRTGENAWSPYPMDRFAYTLNGARTRIRSNRIAFKGCRVSFNCN